MDFDFEFVIEGFALGLDAIIIGFLLKSYESCSSYIEALKVKTFLLTQRNGSLFYLFVYLRLTYFIS